MELRVSNNMMKLFSFFVYCRFSYGTCKKNFYFYYYFLRVYIDLLIVVYVLLP